VIWKGKPRCNARLLAGTHLGTDPALRQRARTNEARLLSQLDRIAGERAAAVALGNQPLIEALDHVTRRTRSEMAYPPANAPDTNTLQVVPAPPGAAGQPGPCPAEMHGNLSSGAAP
jgi:hypothetical protein